MEGRCDLRKFITELPVAERGAVLSSGRGLLVPAARSRRSRSVARWWRRGGCGLHRNGSATRNGSRNWQCGAAHSGGGIEGPTQMDSDQTAAEALQEAETEVGVA